MTTHLYVRDSTGDVIHEIDEYEQFDAVLRDRDVSSWSFSAPPTQATLALGEPGAGIVVQRDGRDILSGPMREDERKWAEGDDALILSGYSDDIALWDRIAYPTVPIGTSGSVFANAAHDVRTGNAETVIKGYVTANLITGGSFAGGGRAVSGLTAAPNLARGTTVTGRARFQVLGVLLQELSLPGGDLGFGILNNVFDVFEHRDRENEAVFSAEIGNLAEYSLKRAAPVATHVVVAGGGEEVERQFVIGGDDAASTRWGRRVEMFRDRRDTVDLVELDQTLVEELADKGEKIEVSLRPIDTDSVTFDRDYRVGDRVNVEGVTAAIREVAITLDADGETIKPDVASATTASAQSLLRIFDAVRNLRRQVGMLERSQ